MFLLTSGRTSGFIVAAYRAMTVHLIGFGQDTRGSGEAMDVERVNDDNGQVTVCCLTDQFIFPATGSLNHYALEVIPA